LWWEGHRTLRPRKGEVGRISFRFRQQQLGEAVSESGNCSFSSMERVRESGDNRGDELSGAPAMSALKRTKIIPESRLTRVSAAPPRQSPLFTKGSAKRGDPRGLTGLNSWTDGVGWMWLPKLSFDSSSTGKSDHMERAWQYISPDRPCVAFADHILNRRLPCVVRGSPIRGNRSTILTITARTATPILQQTQTFQEDTLSWILAPPGGSSHC
jgi:hypothetical protein